MMPADYIPTQDLGYGIDNDGPYSPDNCRWATASEQSRNRRTFGWENRRRDERGQFV